MKRLSVATWLIVGVVGVSAATATTEMPSVGQSPAEAIVRCREAAEQGDAESQFTLGVRYANGQGVKQSYTEAAKWFLKAAEQGNQGKRIKIAMGEKC